MVSMCQGAQGADKKREARSEKREARSEKREARSEKREARSENMEQKVRKQYLAFKNGIDKGSTIRMGGRNVDNQSLWSSNIYLLASAFIYWFLQRQY